MELPTTYLVRKGSFRPQQNHHSIVGIADVFAIAQISSDFSFKSAIILHK